MADEWQIVNGPEGPLRFPKSMSRDDMAAQIEQKYNPARSNVSGKDQYGANAPQNVGTLNDVVHSAGQWARDTGEHILAIPRQADDLERSINNWLQGSGAESPLAQSLGIGDAMKGTGKFLEEHVTPKESQLINGVPAPTLEESQWTGKQMMGDPYKPQTLAGQVTGPALTGATIGLGGALAAPKAIGAAQTLGAIGKNVAVPLAAGTYTYNQMRRMFGGSR